MNSYELIVQMNKKIVQMNKKIVQMNKKIVQMSMKQTRLTIGCLKTPVVPRAVVQANNSSNEQ